MIHARLFDQIIHACLVNQIIHAYLFKQIMHACLLVSLACMPIQAYFYWPLRSYKCSTLKFTPIRNTCVPNQDKKIAYAFILCRNKNRHVHTHIYCVHTRAHVITHVLMEIAEVHTHICKFFRLRKDKTRAQIHSICLYMYT
jgi:hypothetical protein